MLRSLPASDLGVGPTDAASWFLGRQIAMRAEGILCCGKHISKSSINYSRSDHD